MMMKRLLILCLFSSCVLFSLDAAGAAEKTRAPRVIEHPDAPAYLILRVPSRSHKGRVYYQGRGYAVRTRPYAYGWFGARPKRHWYRSSGYHSDYIQWQRP